MYLNYQKYLLCRNMTSVTDLLLKITIISLLLVYYRINLRGTHQDQFYIVLYNKHKKTTKKNKT